MKNIKFFGKRFDMWCFNNELILPTRIKEVCIHFDPLCEIGIIICRMARGWPGSPYT